VQFAVLYIPRSPGVPVEGLPLDKLVHLAVFAVPTYLLIAAGLPRTVVVVVMLGQAVGSEVVQAMALTQRSGDVGDVLADLVGIGVGLMLVRRPLHPQVSRSDATNHPGAPG
jgi:hypothetical protein